MPARLPDGEGLDLAGEASASDASPRRDETGQSIDNPRRPSTSRDAAASPPPPPLVNPWQLADVARSVSHDAWDGGPALHTSLARAIIDHVGPGAVLAPSPADFLADSALSDLHLPCFPTEPEGYGQALAAARDFAAQDTGLGEPPLLLLVQARGGQLQAILARAAQMDIRAHVVLLGSVQADPCTRDGWQLAALVHKLWGHRAANALSNVVPVGQPIRSRLRGARQFFLGVAPTLRPCTVDPPLIRLSLCPAEPHAVGPLTVMAQASRRDDLEAELSRTTRACSTVGARLLVFSRPCWPSLEPGMQDEDVQPLTIYTLRWAGTCPTQAGAVRTALQTLRNFVDLEATPTHWITAVSAAELPGAVLHSVGASAMCTVAARWQKAAAPLGGRVVATTAGLGLLNIPPAVAQVCLEADPLRDSALAAPIRLTGHVASTSDGLQQPASPSGTAPSARPSLHLDFTFTAPTAGHDLLWLVATAGQHTAHSVARAATDGLGAPVAAAEENAWNPLSGAFEQMVLLTIPGHTRDAMERGPGAQRTLLVDGHALPLLPFTHFAPPSASRSPRVDTPAENLRSSIVRTAASGSQLGPRTTMVAPPVVRMPRGILPPDTPLARSAAVRTGALTTQFMHCGAGAWLHAGPVVEDGAVPASTTACFVGTHLDALLFPVPTHQVGAGAEPPPLTPQHLDGLASQDWFPSDLHRRTWVTAGVEHAHAPVNLSLSPGDFLVASAPSGAIVELLGPTERLTATLPHPAWLIVRQPARAALRAASHGLPDATEVCIRHAVGVWTHCRRLPPGAGAAPRAVPRRLASAPDGMDTVSQHPPERARAPPPPAANSLTFWRPFMLRLEEKCRAMPAEPPASTAGMPHLRPLARDAASCVMQHWRGPGVAIPRLAAWLHAHVLVLAQRPSPPTAWQWDLTCYAWAVHAAAADQPADASAVQRLGGILELTARQNPFAAWRLGRPGLPAGTVVPGTRALCAATRQRLGRCTREIGPAAHAALGRLVSAALTASESRATHAPAAALGAAAAPDTTPAQEEHLQPMDVDSQHTPDDTSRPPGPRDAAPHSGASASADPLLAGQPVAPALAAPPSRHPPRAASRTPANASPISAQPPAALPAAHAENREGASHAAARAHRPAAEAPGAAATAQPAPRDAPGIRPPDSRTLVVDLTDLPDGSPPSAPPAAPSLVPVPTTATPRASRLRPSGAGALERGQSARAKAPRQRPPRQDRTRPSRKQGSRSAAQPDAEPTGRRRKAPEDLRIDPPASSVASADAALPPSGLEAPTAPAASRRRLEALPPCVACPPPSTPASLPNTSSLAGPDVERSASSLHPVPTLLALLRTADGSLPASAARSQLAARGYPGHFDSAVAFWRTTGFLMVEGTDGDPRLRLLRQDCITPDSPVNPGHWYPLAPPPGRASGLSEQHSGGRPLALLSLFDGTGMARVALESALARLGATGPSFVASAFAELQPNLASAVQALWAQQAQTSGGPPHSCIAHDVWDLFRPSSGSTPLHHFAQDLPFGTCVLLIAGPPCQDLTVATRAAGTRGLCGDRSCHFYATPLAAWCLQAIRPDLIVHVLVENVSSMKTMFRAEIVRALNLPSPAHATTLDSQAWCPFPRRRLFFSTLPPPSRRAAPPRRPSPWDEGWAPRPDTSFHPMMQSRSPPGSAIQASTSHYHPRRLLYQDASPHHWQGGNWQRVEKRIRQLLPALLRDSYAALLTGPKRAQEAEALPAAQWIEREGRAHGFRVPSARERARAMGQESYLARLLQQPGSPFGERDLFDWTGSHFDPDAVATCLMESLGSDAYQQPHEFLTTTALLGGYYAVRQQLPAHPLLQDHPVPSDLLAAFQAATGPPGADTPPPAADAGRLRCPPPPVAPPPRGTAPIDAAP